MARPQAPRKPSRLLKKSAASLYRLPAVFTMLIVAGRGGSRMRGRREPQVTMLAFIDLEERVPIDHPLRAIKRLADAALADLSPTFDAMYRAGGRPSIPPERLLKASLLIALYSVRSERAFCEELD